MNQMRRKRSLWLKCTPVHFTSTTPHYTTPSRTDTAHIHGKVRPPIAPKVWRMRVHIFVVGGTSLFVSFRLVGVLCVNERAFRILTD